MSAPSVLHEVRVALLGDLATLAGYTVEVDMWFAMRPDVVRLHFGRPALLIGDAKASENSRSAATRGRLRSYAEAAREWLTAGFGVHLAVAHGPDDSDWLACLEDIADLVGVTSRGSGRQNLGGEDWVSLTELLLS